MQQAKNAYLQGIPNSNKESGFIKKRTGQVALESIGGEFQKRELVKRGDTEPERV